MNDFLKLDFPPFCVGYSDGCVKIEIVISKYTVDNQFGPGVQNQIGDQLRKM